MPITKQELYDIFGGNVPMEAEYEQILSDGSDTRTMDEVRSELRALAARREEGMLQVVKPVKLSYFAALVEAMRICSQQRNAIFMGQGVGLAGGTTMSQTLVAVPAKLRLEMPVAEDMQMGMAIGMSLEGILPICIFPRWNFLLLAANQLINHLDRLPLYSDGGYKPKVIIRTAIPSTDPFDPGPQHNDDFTDAFAMMTRTIKIVRLKEAELIVPAYRAAIESEGSTLLVEYTNSYRDERAKA